MTSLEFLLLAALWGGSFTFMRAAAPEFGPWSMMLLRCGIGAAFLLPLLAWRGQTAGLRTHWRALAVIGVANSALPFALYGYAALMLPSGVVSVLNATVPLFAAVLAWAWLRERLAPAQVAGLLLGFVGVGALVTGRAAGQVVGGDAAFLGGLAGLAAASCYAFAVVWTRAQGHAVHPLVTAAGSQAFATLALLGPGVVTWPATMPSSEAWLAVLGLGIPCTGIAYLLYFRLIAALGAARAATVTFVIPVFAIAWGMLAFDESVTLRMVVSGLVVLVGTALVNGAWKLLRRPRDG